MNRRLLFLWQHPFAPLLPWVGGVLSLLCVWFLVHGFGVISVQTSRDRLESEWTATRQALLSHREARKAKKDVNRVWEMLSPEGEFTSLALGISDQAKKEQVTLPTLSSKTEPTSIEKTSKGLLQGPMTGRYEDLRRFINGIETRDELMFIENLELSRSGGVQDGLLTFNIRIATYLRGERSEPNSPRTTP